MYTSRRNRWWRSVPWDIDFELEPHWKRPWAENVSSQQETIGGRETMPKPALNSPELQDLLCVSHRNLCSRSRVLCDVRSGMLSRKQGAGNRHTWNKKDKWSSDDFLKILSPPYVQPEDIGSHSLFKTAPQ